MKKKIGKQIRAIPSREFTSDPVAFGALMEFQYGSGEKSREAAEKILFTEMRGFSCKSIEELPIVLPKLDYWVSVEKGKEKTRKYRLYMNNRPASRLGAKLLADLGYAFDVVPTTEIALSVGLMTEKCPLPILVDTREGGMCGSLSMIKRFLRTRAIPDRSRKHHTAYFPYHIDFNNDGWYKDELGKFKCATVWCFDNTGQVAFKGAIEKAPYPVASMAEAHWYVKNTGKPDAFSNLAVWNLGAWEEIKKHIGSHGHLIQKNPPAVLFADEIKALDDGVDHLIIDDSAERGFASVVNYDAYFLINGVLYRIYGLDID